MVNMSIHDLSQAMNVSYEQAAKRAGQYAMMTGVQYRTEGKRKLIPAGDYQAILEANQLVRNRVHGCFRAAVEHVRLQIRSDEVTARPMTVLTAVLAAQQAHTALERHLQLSLGRDDMAGVSQRVGEFGAALQEAVEIVSALPDPTGTGLSDEEQQGLIWIAVELASLVRLVTPIDVMLHGVVMTLRRQDDKAYKMFERLLDDWRQLSVPTTADAEANMPAAPPTSSGTDGMWELQPDVTSLEKDVQDDTNAAQGDEVTPYAGDAIGYRHVSERVDEPLDGASPATMEYLHDGVTTAPLQAEGCDGAIHAGRD